MTDELDYSGAREFDDLHDQDEATLLAIRKFLHGVAGTEAETDVGPMEAAQRALYRFDQLAEENERLHEQLAETEQRANQALGVAQSTGGSSGGTSKVDQARHAARNEVVKRALLDTSSSSGGGVTVADVQAMLRPEHDVAYQTVKDAFGDLVEEWPDFALGETEDGTRALQVRKGALSEQVVGLVEVDLGRDDLTKRLISRRGRNGGSTKSELSDPSVTKELISRREEDGGR